jgi:hypothetical protein
MAGIHGPEQNELRDDLARLKTQYLRRQERRQIDGTPGVGRLSVVAQILRRLMTIVLVLVLLYGCVLGALLLGKWLLRRFVEWWGMID